MTSRQTRIGTITHARVNSWGKDERGVIRGRTPCGVLYTHQKLELVNGVFLAEHTRRDVDCMGCLVLKGRE